MIDILIKNYPYPKIFVVTFWKMYKLGIKYQHKTLILIQNRLIKFSSEDL